MRAHALIKEGVLAGGLGGSMRLKAKRARAGGQSHKLALIGDWLCKGAAVVVI